MNQSDDRWLLGISLVVTVFFQLLGVIIYALAVLLVIGVVVVSCSVLAAPPPNPPEALGSGSVTHEQAFLAPEADET